MSINILERADRVVVKGMKFVSRELTPPGVIYNLLAFQMGVRGSFSRKYREAVVDEMVENIVACGGITPYELRAVNLFPPADKQVAHQRIRGAIGEYLDSSDTGYARKY